MNANQSAVIDFLRASMEKEHKAKSRIPKPPTRLQKQAPASLHLDQVSSTSMAPGGAETSSKAILPLLSPLPLSPQPWPETEENNTNRVSAANENAVDGGGDQRGICFAAPGGWQHPAVAAAFPDPSTLFTFFQSQCMVTSNTP